MAKTRNWKSGRSFQWMNQLVALWWRRRKEIKTKNTMSTENNATTITRDQSQQVAELISNVIDTRRYGQTYIKVAVRKSSKSPFEAAVGTLDGREVRFSFCGWGRSLSRGGHKYKAHCNYSDTGKPVPTKRLCEIVG